MNVVKNHMKLVILLLAAILIGGGTCYFNVILSPQLETLRSLKYQNGEKRLELQSLKRELKMLPERKKELMDIQGYVETLKNKTPTYDTSIRIMMEIMQYMEARNFQDLDINMAEPIKQEDEINHYYKVPVTIKYTTTYADTVNFLEAINRSYQMLTIDYFSIDNSVQEQVSLEENKLVSGDTVSTELILCLYYMDGEKEIYPNYVEFVVGDENVFLRPGVWENKDEKKEYDN